MLGGHLKIMNDASPSGDKPPPRQGRSKVKTGCRTCKIRKVKCDEVRPCCHRCVSTGRNCDGYGVWGGGSAALAHLRRARLIDGSHALPLERRCLSPLPNHLGQDERRSFEWFRFCTAASMPGPLDVSAWESLVLPVSLAEPAVMHALLALGEAHRTRYGSREHQPVRAGEAVDKAEQFVLRHYIQAIRHLQPHFASKSLASVRVTLTVCLVFITLECLRGRFRTGNQHICSGMRLLGVFADGDDVVDLNVLRDPLDVWLMETVAKTNLQANLVGQGLRSNYRSSESLYSVALPVVFGSAAEARKRLEMLQAGIVRLASRWRDLHESCPARHHHPPADMVDAQSTIIAGLRMWERVHTVSRVNLVAQLGSLGPVAYILLRMHCLVAGVMASTCLASDGETSFDSHAGAFARIVADATEAQRLASSAKGSGHVPYSTDKGWIQPLYFAALKCRVRGVRLQAARLLARSRHTEGIWSAEMAAAVASEVMRLEDADGLQWDACAAEVELGPATVPEEKRLRDVRVVLPDSCSESVVIVCTASAAPHAVFAREYDPVVKKWRQPRSRYNKSTGHS